MQEKTIWGIHAGKSQDELFRSKNLIAINWSKMGDLSSLKEMQAIKSKYSQKYSTAKVKTIRGVCEQIYNFVNEISKGDLVVYLSPKSEDVKIGEIVGVYEYNTEISQRYPNQRKVKWLKSVPKKIFSQNALNEISSEKKLCQIKHYAYEYYVNLESKIPVNFNWDVDVAQKLLLHVDNLFHQRVNIFFGSRRHSLCGICCNVKLLTIQDCEGTNMYSRSFFNALVRIHAFKIICWTY